MIARRTVLLVRLGLSRQLRPHDLFELLDVDALGRAFIVDVDLKKGRKKKKEKRKEKKEKKERKKEREREREREREKMMCRELGDKKQKKERG